MPAGTNAVTTTLNILVSTVPAELIQTEGPANLVPIEGTDLMQIQNSDNALFFNDQNQRYSSIIMGSTPGRVGSGRTTGAHISIRTRAALGTELLSSILAPTMAIFTPVFRSLQRHKHSTSEIFTAAEMGACTDPIRPVRGSETQAQRGTLSHKPHELSWSNKHPAAAWANSGSTTFVRMVEAFPTRPSAGLAISAADTLADEVTGNWIYENGQKRHTRRKIALRVHWLSAHQSNRKSNRGS